MEVVVSLWLQTFALAISTLRLSHFFAYQEDWSRRRSRHTRQNLNFTLFDFSGFSVHHKSWKFSITGASARSLRDLAAYIYGALLPWEHSARLEPKVRCPVPAEMPWICLIGWLCQSSAWCKCKSYLYWEIVKYTTYWHIIVLDNIWYNWYTYHIVCMYVYIYIYYITKASFW